MIEGYDEELERRTAQFLGFLQRMGPRARIEVKESCFAIFDEEQPGVAGPPQLSARTAKKLVLASGPVGSQFSLSSGEDSWPEDGWRDEHDPGAKRFVQFAFVNRFFFIDLPRHTLTPDEARRLLRDRRGFFYLKDRPAFGESMTSEHQIQLHDPFCKVYLHGDEGSAAEDTTYIFFALWHFPVDWRFYFTAFSGGDPCVYFENGVGLA
jgi:hypothetical protein